MIQILVLKNRGTKRGFIEDQVDDMIDYFEKDAPRRLGVKEREFNFTYQDVEVPIELVVIGTTSQGREAKGADNVKRHLDVERGKYDAVFFVYDGTPSFSKKGWYNAAFTYKDPLYPGTQMVQIPDTADDETFQHEWMHCEAKLHEENGHKISDQMDRTLVNGKWIPYYKDNQPTYNGGNFHQTFKSIDPHFTGSFNNRLALNANKIIVTDIVKKVSDNYTANQLKFFETNTYKKMVSWSVNNYPNGIFVHHAGGTDANPLADTSEHTANGVELWHLGKGWDGLGYHYFIHKNGDIWKGRPEHRNGAHARGYNTTSIGICLAGNFDATDPTPEQVKSLTLLMKDIKQRNKNIKFIKPHRDVANKTCYGTRLSDTWAADLLEDKVIPSVTGNSYTEPTVVLPKTWNETISDYTDDQLLVEIKRRLIS